MIKYAACEKTRGCLERMIRDPTGKQENKKQKKKPQLSVSNYLLAKQTVKYVCLTCSETENIPLDVVRDFGRMDQGDPTVPSQFTCESCGGAMYPEYYKGVRGHEYKINDLGKT